MYEWPKVPIVNTRKRLAEQYGPHEDNGFFGPGTVTWKVWAYPTSYILGFARSVTIEHLDPNLTAAVVTSGGVKYRPHTRYGRTLTYFGQVAFGATRPTAKAADVLVKVHSKAIGNDPVTGGRYDANKPSSQLWIHMTAWHSILYCYEKFGPGRLSAGEETQYWTECARAAELQTIDPATVPRSREEVIAYFDDWRPHLAASEAAADMVHFILNLEVALPPQMSARQRLLFKPLTTLLSKGVVATYPKYMRDLLNVQQSPLVDALVTPPLRALHTLLDRWLFARVFLMAVLAPQALPVVAPVVLGIPAENDITMTPRQAQREYGFDEPAQAHLGMRAKQYDRVFDKGERPSDEGLIESQQHIGAMEPRTAV
ncbi:oxygenase MpaB family protein [Williamsia sterculiae]|uniref:Uncharacterized conserved protein, DUF2236 family n=1 Tax=Williamsia sterculiae TaxID=1344003 RepID=A0A1N7GRF4_9NOCA|nr:oxygenase MpaB family protein [Williamsia sterculiae]SIS15129.1 Uncharacterized conserved protein, DUF2236 family [Williamsia sterculiae]